MRLFKSSISASLLVLLLVGTAFADDLRRGRLLWTDPDGNPDQTPFSEITTASGALTDDGDGTATLSNVGAPTSADYLVGTANGDLSAEIVVGTTPGGELGGTWGSPTVDSTHSGSAHHSAVTLSGTPDYITLSGQDIVRGSVDLAADVTGTLPVGNGGTGATTLTDGGILLGSGTGAITALGVAANGQIPIGDGTTDPVLAGITGTANQVTVTNGAGSITLSTPQNIHTAATPTFGTLTLTQANPSATLQHTGGSVGGLHAEAGDLHYWREAGGPIGWLLDALDALHLGQPGAPIKNLSVHTTDTGDTAVKLPGSSIGLGEVDFSNSPTSGQFVSFTGDRFTWISQDSAGNAFETISVPAGTNPVADSATDTLTITETSPLVITGTAATDTIDITWSSVDLGADGTIQPNSVALATDTTGAYVADLAEGTAIDVSGGGAENATVTVAFDSTEVENTTWGGGTGASQTWTWDNSSGAGDDPVLLFNNNGITFSMTLGNFILADGSGDTPRLNFQPQSGTLWSVFVEDTGDDLQIEADFTSSTETIDIVNSGDGVAELNVEGDVRSNQAIESLAVAPVIRLTDTNGDDYELWLNDNTFGLANVTDGAQIFRTTQANEFQTITKLITEGGADLNGTVKVGGNDLDLIQPEANIIVGGANPKKSFFVPATAMWPSTTAGASDVTKRALAVNSVDVQTIDFDTTTQEFAQFSVMMPLNYDAGTLTYHVTWTASEANAGAVVWELQGRAHPNDSALDQAWGTAVEITDTFIAANDLHKTSESTALTLAGTVAAGDYVHFRIARDPANAADTKAGDADLLGVRIEYGISQYNDT